MSCLRRRLRRLGDGGGGRLRSELGMRAVHAEPAAGLMGAVPACRSCCASLPELLCQQHQSSVQHGVSAAHHVWRAAAAMLPSDLQ